MWRGSIGPALLLVGSFAWSAHYPRFGVTKHATPGGGPKSMCRRSGGGAHLGRRGPVFRVRGRASG